MKRMTLQSLSLFCILLLVSSCENQDKKALDEFNYVIQGTVINGDSIAISLYRPSEGLDNRQTVVIQDGKYRFSGTARYPEHANIRFEKDIIDPGSVYCNAFVFIEQDTVVLNFEVVERDFGLCYKDRKVMKGETNLFNKKAGEEFSQLVQPTMIFSDKKKMDSMQKYVYPVVRTQMLNAYEKLYQPNDYPAVSLYMLDNLVINSRKIFDPDFLTQEEKDKLVNFLEGIDASLHNTHGYIYVKNYFENLISEKPLIFKDFSLLNINDKTQSISEVISQNSTTMLYFWHTACVPCRKYIKETSQEYSMLKGHGIEIISINSDQSQARWKDSSAKDGIPWVNLYAGDKADIVSYYNVTYYPTMLVFDKEMKLLSSEYIDRNELIELSNKQE